VRREEERMRMKLLHVLYSIRNSTKCIQYSDGIDGAFASHENRIIKENTENSFYKQLALSFAFIEILSQ
jgi:hypothetical protein